MDFYRSPDHYILGKGEQSLWCNRADGNLKLRSASAMKDLHLEAQCSGRVYAVVGKIQFLPGSDFKLVLVTKRSKVANLPDGSAVFRIDKVTLVPLSADDCSELDLDSCDEHQDHVPFRQVARDMQPKVTQTFNNFKTSLANQFKGSGKTNAQKAMEKDIREKEKLDKLERRLQEEFIKMFNDSDSFFYSEHGDLTNTLQRNNENKDHHDKKLPVWKMADDRFFWNKAMLKEIIALTELDAAANDWVVPVMQGYVQHSSCEVDFSNVEHSILMQLAPENFDLTLISRRSVARAGTRYKRRGVDEDGNVANYVETEQIVQAGHHYLSFVQTRGSIPIFWSQAGIKYRPPPKLDRTKAESQEAMKKHFENELELYKKLVVINLVDQTGREQIMSDSLMEHIIMLNDELVTYVTFDFHEYCRGMKFEKVSVLMDSLAEITENILYCWVDRRGMICGQRGIFRVNCMDCLDRTNVVQMSLARYVLKSQLRKLGRLMPEQDLPSDVRDKYHNIWANNGDAISRQYAGTAAMKGDFTRTGERRFTGVMKDGYHSANRYLNRFTAAYRQTVIDIMLGIAPTEDISLLIAAMKQPEDAGEEWTMQREEWVAQLVNHCQQLLVNEDEGCIGGWALIEPRISSEGEVDPEFEQEVVLLLTDKTFYVSRYEEEDEYVNQYEKESLADLEKIEIGPDSSLDTRNRYLRLHYRSDGETGYFRTFQAVQNRTPDEGLAVLLGIADEFLKACDAMDLNPKIKECQLNKKKSKRHNVIQLSTKSRPFRTDASSRINKTSGEVNKLASCNHGDSSERNIRDYEPTMNMAPEENRVITNFFDRPSTGSGTKDPLSGSTDLSEMNQVDVRDNTRADAREDPRADDTREDDLLRDHESEVTNNQCRTENVPRGDTRVYTREDANEDRSNDTLEDTRDDTRVYNPSRREQNSFEDNNSALKVKDKDRKSGNEQNDENEKNSESERNSESGANVQNEQKTSGMSNLKKMIRNRFDDVSVRFQRNKDSDTGMEIVWQSEEGSGESEAARVPGKRNIFTAAQERGRTIIPDLKNKLSGLSNRSPKFERKRDWGQVIKDSECKTRIIQV